MMEEIDITSVEKEINVLLQESQKFIQTYRHIEALNRLIKAQELVVYDRLRNYLYDKQYI